MIISIDFDGTIVHDMYPKIGTLRDNAKTVINELYKEHYIIINTCRAGIFEAQVALFLKKNGINYHYINTNIPEQVEKYGQDCRKISADVYIDDKDIKGVPSWTEIRYLIKLKQDEHTIKYNII